MTFWSGEKLLDNRNVVSEFSEDRIDCNAYTLRMGNCYFRTAEAEDNEPPQKVFLTPGQPFVIPPGQFGYLLSKETVRVPNSCMAFISMRTTIKYRGLINVSGFHVHPGYEGKLIYAVYNASPTPIPLCENDPIFKIWFASLDRTSSGKFVYAGKGISEISSDLVHGMSTAILSLQSLSKSLRDYDSKFAEQKSVIDTLNIVWRTVIIAAIVAVIATLFSVVVTFGLPSVYALGQRFADRWVSIAPAPSNGTQAPKQSGQPSTAQPPNSPSSPKKPQ